MNRKQKHIKKLLLQVSFSISICIFSGCSLTGSVINHGKFETALTHMHLKGTSRIKIYYGGTRRSIPLKEIHMITISPSSSITIDNELYFSADIIMKDGTRIQSNDNEISVQTKVYVCIHHELVGKQNGEKFITGFEQISRLTVK